MIEKKQKSPAATRLPVHMARGFLLLLSILFGIEGVCHAQSTEEIRLSITKNVTDQIDHSQFSPVFDRFTSDLKDSFTQDQLETQMKELVTSAGSFQTQLSQEIRTVAGMPIYVSRSHFEKFDVKLEMMFDQDNQITRLRMIPVSDLSTADMEASASETTDLLWQQRFDLLASQFDEQFKTGTTPEHLEMSRAYIVEHFGQFKSIKLATKDPDWDLVDVRCEFEHGDIIVRLAFDIYGKVSGIWMRPVQLKDDSVEIEKV